MDHIFTTTALSKRYRHTKALDQLSMQVPRGAIYGFVGRNGSGKTTLKTPALASIWRGADSAPSLRRHRFIIISAPPTICASSTAFLDYRASQIFLTCCGWSGFRIPGARKRGIFPLA